MSEITKMLAAAALLAAGFFGASWFGKPAGEQAAGSASGNWAPEPLQPIEAAPAPAQGTQARSTWDNQVAPAGMFEEAAPASQPNRYEAARLAWPDQAGGFDAAPAIRSEGGVSGMSPVSEDDRFASLDAPQLLELRETVRPLRSSTFPTQPAAAQPPVAEASPAPMFDNRSSFANFEQNTLVPQTAPWQAPALTAANQSLSGSGEAVWHVVSDGDSLPQLAERYLGDASRAREIYELNRDTLMNPDLLPIGEKLRIPQRASEPSQFNVYDASGSPTASYTPQRRLVPLPELPDSVRNAPRARLQRPVSASLAGTGG